MKAASSFGNTSEPLRGVETPKPGRLYTLKTALLVQFIFSVLLLACAVLNLHYLNLAEEDRLASEAGRIASRTALVLAVPVFDDDYLISRQMILAEMDDSRVSGMAVFKDERLVDGLRRDSDWEAVPWDDLTPDDSVEGIKSLIVEERQIGVVVVYLSRRILEEIMSAAVQREVWRFMSLFIFMALLQTVIAKKSRLAGSGQRQRVRIASEVLYKPEVGVQARPKPEASSTRPRLAPSPVAPRPHEPSHDFPVRPETSLSARSELAANDTPLANEPVAEPDSESRLHNESVCGAAPAPDTAVEAAPAESHAPGLDVNVPEDFEPAPSNPAVPVAAEPTSEALPRLTPDSVLVLPPEPAVEVLPEAGPVQESLPGFEPAPEVPLRPRPEPVSEVPPRPMSALEILSRLEPAPEVEPEPKPILKASARPMSASEILSKLEPEVPLQPMGAAQAAPRARPASEPPVNLEPEPEVSSALSPEVPPEPLSEPEPGVGPQPERTLDALSKPLVTASERAAVEARHPIRPLAEEVAEVLLQAEEQAGSAAENKPDIKNGHNGEVLSYTGTFERARAGAEMEEGGNSLSRTDVFERVEPRPEIFTPPSPEPEKPSAKKSAPKRVITEQPEKFSASFKELTEKFFQACQYAPLQLIILAADGKSADLQKVASRIFRNTLLLNRVVKPLAEKERQAVKNARSGMERLTGFFSGKKPLSAPGKAEMLQKLSEKLCGELKALDEALNTKNASAGRLAEASALTLSAILRSIAPRV